MSLISKSARVLANHRADLLILLHHHAIPGRQTVVVVLKNQDEEFPGNIRDMKIASVGENLSAILFGVDRMPQQKAEK
jgi:hypothetical protein